MGRTEVEPGGRVREICIYGHPALRKAATPVLQMDDQTRQLIADLVATMLARDGLGLAANQIGELREIIALDPAAIGIGQDTLVLINPRIISCAGEIEREEACLSLPGISEVLIRPARATVQALNLEGERIEVKAEGTLARALLHEIDHLHGVLFVDHLSALRRKLLEAKLKELKSRSCA